METFPEVNIKIRFRLTKRVFYCHVGLDSRKNTVQKIAYLKKQSFHDTQSKCPWFFFTLMTFNNLFSREGE